MAELESARQWTPCPAVPPARPGREGATPGPVDIHTLGDTEIDLDKVGVKGVRYPIVVLDKAAGRQHTVGSFDMFVDLPNAYKGAHMSRFLEVLNEHRGEIGIEHLPVILTEMQTKLQARRARLEVEFPYFLEKRAPVTGSPGMMAYTCRILGRADERGVDLGLEVRVPIMTLCPCSKELSVRGPHNQRGEARIKVRFHRIVWIEDLIAMVEACASSEIYSLLKRADEKHVADWAYDHPVFVEDVVRNVAGALNEDANITWYAVEAETMESIHAHNAFAAIESGSGAA